MQQGTVGLGTSLALVVVAQRIGASNVVHAAHATLPNRHDIGCVEREREWVWLWKVAYK